MKSYKVKKGNWKVSKSGNPTFSKCVIAEDGGSICFVTNWLNADVIAKLIADAGTTTNKCGLLPSELLKQRNELLEALIEANGELKNLYNYVKKVRNQILELDVDVSHIGIGELDNIWIIGMKSEKAINTALKK